MKILFIVTEDWTFVSHRLHIARQALAAGHEVAILCSVNRDREAIESAGIKVFDWPLSRRSKNPFAELRAVWAVARCIRMYRPDIVHAVALKPVLYSALAGRISGRPRRVAALGGLGFVFSSEKRMARFLRPIMTFGYKAAVNGKTTRLVLQNADDAALFQAAGIARLSDVRLIRGAGVELDSYVPTPEPGGPPLIVLPARMLWDKGVDEFVTCASRIRSNGVAARFALVGERDEHNPECIPEAVLRRWVQSGIVEWWGRRSDMPKVYSQAHVVCLPSYREGLPKALLEAASCSRPIVAFDVPGCREVVVDGVNGFLVPFGDLDRLTSSLETLITSQDLRVKMGEAGRRKVVAEFSSERIAEQTMAIWHELQMESGGAT